MSQIFVAVMRVKASNWPWSGCGTCSASILYSFWLQWNFFEEDTAHDWAFCSELWGTKKHFCNHIFFLKWLTSVVAKSVQERITMAASLSQDWDEVIACFMSQNVRLCVSTSIGTVWQLSGASMCVKDSCSSQMKTEVACETPQKICNIEKSLCHWVHRCFRHH